MTQVGAQGEQTGDPLGEHMQLWVEFRHLPKVEKKSEPGRKQSSMWSQSYKPPPALKPLNLSLNLTSNHQGTMMDMCHTWKKGLQGCCYLYIAVYYMFPLLASPTNVCGVWVGLGGTPRLSDACNRWSTLAVGHSWSR